MWLESTQFPFPPPAPDASFVPALIAWKLMDKKVDLHLLEFVIDYVGGVDNVEIFLSQLYAIKAFDDRLSEDARNRLANR
jgi:hypothetical protein